MTQGSNPQHSPPTPHAAPQQSGNAPQPAQPAPPPSPPSDEVTLTIDGKSLTAKKGTLLVEAAKLIGLEIPVFCYHPKLKSVGACRMCLVQIEKLPRLQTACTTPVAADMVVHTTTPDVIAAQNGVIELLLANHPLDCPICDKGGECPLQDNTFGYGLGVSRFTEEKRHKEKAYPLGRHIILDRERCIMCYRCVRFHQEIPGDEALAAVQRGPDSEIDTLTGESYDSIFSGNTTELCPVGALTSRDYRFKARPWDLVRTPSVCNGCSVGCNIEVHSRTETVLRLQSRENPTVDGGWLCDVGRYETMPAPHSARPARPMLREGGALRVATWSEALQRTAELLQNGSVLASGGLSNEAFWLLERTRLNAALWPAVEDTWPVTGAIENLAKSKTVVLVGLDAWNQLPVLALWIAKAVSNGASLVVLGPENGLWRQTKHWLKEEPAGLIQPLADAIRGSTEGISADLMAAAAAIRATSPAAVLAHPALVRDHREALEALQQALKADALVGAPLLSANGRGAQEFAPTIAGRRAGEVLNAQAILAFGDENWSELDTGPARLILATSQPVPDDPRIDVVLPMAHPYERQATITNLEGRLQRQEGGAMPPLNARTDWGVAAELGRALQVGVPQELSEIRAAMAESHPTFADALTEELLVARV